MEGLAEVMTRAEFQSDSRSQNATWVTKEGWFWNCPGCGQVDTLPLDLLTSFLDSKRRQQFLNQQHDADLLGMDDPAASEVTDPGTSASQIHDPRMPRG